MTNEEFCPVQGATVHALTYQGELAIGTSAMLLAFRSRPITGHSSPTSFES